mmetsp:Transcript_17381/g.40349  ORF Transcript_17381/g.40349 Transcript_17381/m.40349 type:complete len:226 (-) Transcript_17381:599-1276(-)
MSRLLQIRADAPSVETLTFGEVMLIFSSIVLLMIFLLFARLGCNLMIDICIMGDMDRARHTLIQWRDTFCPFCRRRLVTPQVLPPDSEEEGQEMATLDSLLTNLSASDQQMVLESIFPAKILSPEELAEWKNHSHGEGSQSIAETSSGNEDSQSFSTGSVACPICLGDFAIGEDVVLTKPCHHMFHHSCIMEWLKIHHQNACPFCRSVLVRVEDVERILGRSPTR